MTVNEILERAKAELTKQEATLRETVATKRAELKDAERELSDLLVAVGRLTGKGSRKAKRKVNRPAPTRDDVAKVVEALLLEKGVVHSEVLEQAVAEAVTESGKSRMGLKLRLKEVLKDERFVTDDEGCRLAEMAGATKRSAK